MEEQRHEEMANMALQNRWIASSSRSLDGNDLLPPSVGCRAIGKIPHPAHKLLRLGSRNDDAIDRYGLLPGQRPQVDARLRCHRVLNPVVFQGAGQNDVAR
jgi:hypothetical protein